MADIVKTIRASGGHYTTVSGWISGEVAARGDLISLNSISYGDLYNDWAGGLDDTFSMTGWTADSSYYPVLRAASSAGTQGASAHDGTPGSGARVIKSVNGILATITTGYARVIGIEFQNTSTTSFDYAMQISTNHQIRRCIVKGGTSASSSYGIFVNGNSTTVQNTLVYESGSHGVYHAGNKTGLSFLHCTFVGNGGNGLDYSNTGLDGDVLIQGCVSYGNGGSDYYGNANSPNASSDYNAALDNTQYGTNSFDLSADPFLDSANDDYRIGTGSALKDAAGASGFGVTADCIGTARPQGTNYDVGWFEYAAGGGPTAYYQDIVGSITPSGGIGKACLRSFAGGFTPSGSLTRGTSRLFAGAFTPSGAIAKQGSKSFTGNISPSGIVALVRARLIALVGVLTPSGSVGRVVSKTLAAAITPAGTLVKSINRALSGSIASNGVVSSIRARLISLAGSLALSGATTKALSKSMSGSLASAGSLVKSTTKSLAGSVASSGVVASIRARLISLAGAITPAGTLAKSTAKSIAGNIASAGTIIKAVAHSLSGSITPTGALSKTRAVFVSLAGSLGLSGLVTRQIGKSIGGSITPSGAITKAVRRLWSGVLGLIGTLVNFATGRPKIDVTVSDSAVSLLTLSDSAVSSVTLSDQLVSGVTLSESTT